MELEVRRGLTLAVPGAGGIPRRRIRGSGSAAFRRDSPARRSAATPSVAAASSPVTLAGSDA